MNSYRMTKDKSLDRAYLRLCAVYRCVKRYGMDKETAVCRLKEVGYKNAKAIFENWGLSDYVKFS